MRGAARGQPRALAEQRLDDALELAARARPCQALPEAASTRRVTMQRAVRLASRASVRILRQPAEISASQSVQWPAFIQPRRLCDAAQALKTLDTPFISDTIPLAEGILGDVQELHKDVGDSVDELEIVAVVETDKVALDIRATQAGVIQEVLVSVGDEVKEKQAIYTLRPRP